jgi:hypothetical protein
MSDSIGLNGTTRRTHRRTWACGDQGEDTGCVGRGTSHSAAVTAHNGFIAFQQVEDFWSPKCADGTSRPFTSSGQVLIGHSATGFNWRCSGDPPRQWRVSGRHIATEERCTSGDKRMY